MLLRSAAAGVLVIGLFSGAAGAATYNVTSILDGTDGDFGYSAFIDQSTWRMGGNHIEDPNPTGMSPGTWDSVTGALSFSSLLYGAGSITVSGILKLNSLGSGSISGVGGFLDVVFAGASNIANGSYRFQFADMLMGTASSPPNSFDSASNMISLWGDLGNYTYLGCSSPNPSVTCIAADLRLQLTPYIPPPPPPPPPPPVPVPASVLMLLSGIGGLLGARKLRKPKR